MAYSSAPGASVSIGYPITEKLVKNNFPLWKWKAQVMLALRGAQVAHFINLTPVCWQREIAKSADKPTEMIPYIVQSMIPGLLRINRF